MYKVIAFINAKDQSPGGLLEAKYYFLCKKLIPEP